MYWDACVFLGLISREAGKVAATEAVWNEAKSGKTRIVTSTFTLAEVVRAKCEELAPKPLSDQDEQLIVNFLTQPFVDRMILDEWLATNARKLWRTYPQCKKPSDAVHLATALYHSVDEMHTWDSSDLLPLDGKVPKRSSEPLIICRPRITAPPAPLPSQDALTGQQRLDLLDGSTGS